MSTGLMLVRRSHSSIDCQGIRGYLPIPDRWQGGTSYTHHPTWSTYLYASFMLRFWCKPRMSLFPIDFAPKFMGKKPPVPWLCLKMPPCMRNWHPWVPLIGWKKWRNFFKNLSLEQMHSGSGRRLPRALQSQGKDLPQWAVTRHRGYF